MLHLHTALLRPEAHPAYHPVFLFRVMPVMIMNRISRVIEISYTITASGSCSNAVAGCNAGRDRLPRPA